MPPTIVLLANIFQRRQASRVGLRLPVCKIAARRLYGCLCHHGLNTPLFRFHHPYYTRIDFEQFTLYATQRLALPAPPRDGGSSCKRAGRMRAPRSISKPRRERALHSRCPRPPLYPSRPPRRLICPIACVAWRIAGRLRQLVCWIDFLFTPP